MPSRGALSPLDFSCRSIAAVIGRTAEKVAEGFNAATYPKALQLLEAQVRLDFPDSVYLAPVVESPLHFCMNLRRFVHLPECTGLVINADAEQFSRCLACEQGKRLAAQSPFKPRKRSVPLPRPDLPAEDPSLVSLASTLRQLTADGRVRVSLLDVQRSLGAPTYDDTMRLVRRAGLTTGRPFGSVPAIAVDHSMRQFLAATEVPHAR